MVERLYLRDLVTFKEVELTFEQGLVVFTGPSGAGKSVLVSAILSAFGHSTKGAATLCEVNLKKPKGLKSDAFLLEDELSIKMIKKEKLRYFLDGQSISIKVLSQMFSPFIKHFSVRDHRAMESHPLLEMIDTSLASRESNFKKLRQEYRKRYILYRKKLSQLQKICDEEKALAEKMEFAQYEIDKISAVDPKPGEEEELLKVKQQLSRIDKIRDALATASEIFNYESSIEEVYRLLDKDLSGFFEAMNQLRADFEEGEMLADDLAEINVEEVLDRLGDLKDLMTRYGSIEDALIYRDEKVKELAGYKHIEQDKSMIEQFLQTEMMELNIIASRISQHRQQEAKTLEKILKGFLSNLKLPPLTFEFKRTELGEEGVDWVEIKLEGSRTDTLSGGEFNRVRLALMAATMPKHTAMQGVLILDEIDANVSGDESIAIADMIEKLSRGYQIFAISHQPHLSAKAKQHILVEKYEKESEVKVLDEKGRIQEIARIVSGEHPTEQAVAFARKLRSN